MKRHFLHEPGSGSASGTEPLLPKSKLGTTLTSLSAGMVAALVMTASDANQAPAGSNPYSQPFTAFESGQVRPLAITPDKKLLLATNTPDAKLEVFRIKHDGLKHLASVPVGLEPVAVAVRGNGEAWVVNHLSDSVSIVKLKGSESRVEKTLLVGDEPRDIVFAGVNKNRAFITTAHRGQNSPTNPELDVPGVGRADVWVFNAEGMDDDASLGGAPLNILTFFADTPRALAVTPDGAKVYAAAFNSGNGTASTFLGSFDTLSKQLQPYAPSNVFPGLNAGVNAFGEEQPFTSAIVKYDGEHWRDETGALRDSEMMFTLPDRDVFAIDANANPPAPVAGPAGVYAHVGTTLFNMIVNPASGKVYVSNLESNNQQRFEGENLFSGNLVLPDPSVKGKIAFSRITVLDGDGSVTPRHLNKHINYDVCCAPIPNDENARSVAFPIGMEITGDGKTLYVAAIGSSEVAVYGTSELENDTFDPDTANQIPVSGGGPTGLALDESKNRLYVLTRFDNAIKIIDTKTKAEVGTAAMFNPEPAQVVNGRRFLYDASFSSSHGDSACFSCHTFGDMDHLAWDLGNPDAANLPDPNVYINDAFPFRKVFPSMKGVMATQSLRGMDNMGPMHWRGDRTGGAQEASAQPNSGSFNEQLAFKEFRAAFPGLLGRNAQIPEPDLHAFTDFILEVMYPPNPIRNLDNSLTPQQQAGSDFFSGPKSSFDPGIDGDQLGTTMRCSDCHTIDRNANAGATSKPGFFGTNGMTAEVGAPESTKIPHLRNMYQKVGKFGFPETALLLLSPGAGEFIGEQIRGFGFLHDGGIDTMFRFLFGGGFGTGDVQVAAPFLGVPVNNPEGIPLTEAGNQTRKALEAFMMAFDSNFAPITGQQVTLTAENAVAAASRIDLLIERANADECQLIARDEKKGEGFLFDGSVFLRDKQAKTPLTDAALRDKASRPQGAVTYTCVPKGNGQRLALDRDLDGVLNGDEVF